MTTRRTLKLNSLLKEVISDVIRKEVSHPKLSEFLTITKVDITKDLHHAKVYFSVIGSEQEKQDTLEALQSASGYIAVLSAKQIVIRYFPTLTFKLDDSVDKHIRINTILDKINEEKQLRDYDLEDFDEQQD